MKVALVITRGDDIGGAQVHVRELAVALQDRGIASVVLAGGDGPFGDFIRGAGLPYHGLRHLARPIRPWRDAQALAELVAALRAVKPDLVATHSSKAGWIGRVAGRLTGIPMIFTAHGWAFSEGVPPLQRWLYRLVERLAAPLADRIITVSDYDRQLAVSQGVVDPDRVVTVHNGLPDVAEGVAGGDRPLPVTFVMVARFAAPKDHATVLRAAAGLRGADWRLQFIGDGPLRAQTETLAAELGIGHRLQCLGERTDVPALLGQAGVFVLASRWEGLPLSIIEAMRAGLPVVATRVGGVPELVQDGETGLLVPGAAPGALQAAMRRLLTDEPLRRRLGAAGRARYEREFSLDQMVERTLAVYADALSGQAAR